jgi:leucyl/phenylalanyl-tRNA--protein transferase
MVLMVDEIRVSRSLRRVMRSGRYRVSLDTAFTDVMVGCAEPRLDEAGTWITAEMLKAYTRLATEGFAHSVEVWADEVLAGGLYGVAIGRMFYGESMFTRQTDASKVALATLVRQLDRWGFQMIDCQMATDHLASMGAREIPRSEFVDRVRRLANEAAVASPWTLDADL